jgi:hypothetical protein
MSGKSGRFAGKPAGVLFLASPPALVFAALVVATVGAFFVTTRLKRSTPVLAHLTFNRHFSPNGDGRLDFAVFAFRLRRTDDATVSIVTRDGDQVRTLAENRRLERDRQHRFRWDGRTSAGLVAPDGEYHIRVGLRHQGRTVTSPRKLFLDTTPPRPVVRYVSPAVITPSGTGERRGRATLRFVGPTRAPTLRVYRTDLGRPRLVARRVGRSGSAELSWDGMTGLGRQRRPAAAGSYLLAVRVRDAAGNVGPPRLPPSRKTVRGHPGVEVRYLAATGPDAPVTPGTLARFSVLGAGRRYRWRVRRLGSSRSLARGASRAGTLHVRVPRRLSGLAFLDLRVGSHRYETPFAVRARRRRPVLVLLPTITWQARNPIEADGDGFPDVLPLDRRVGVNRPFAGDGRPPGFAEAVSLLTFLRRAGLRYDLTTDLAVLRAGAGSIGRYRGVLVAGPERFAPATLTDGLRADVQAGQRLAWTGIGGFSRDVKLTRAAIEDVSGRGAPASFGERVREEPTELSLIVLGDRLDFFGGVGGQFGPFPAVEQSLRLPRGARLVASAGAVPHRPSIVVYRLGRGYVARIGVQGFGHSLETSPDAGRIMRRLWTLLSR